MHTSYRYTALLQIQALPKEFLRSCDPSSMGQMQNRRCRCFCLSLNATESNSNLQFFNPSPDRNALRSVPLQPHRKSRYHTLWIHKMQDGTLLDWRLPCSDSLWRSPKVPKICRAFSGNGTRRLFTWRILRTPEPVGAKLRDLGGFFTFLS